MTSVSKNVYIDKLDDIVNKYIDTYHSTIKLISANVKLSTYIDSSKEIDDQDSKYKIDYTVRISKYKNIFGKDYVPNQFQEVDVVKKIKNAVSLTYFISDLKSQQIVGTFYKKELQKTNEKEFRADKVIKRKSNKLYVKWKGYNSFVNSCIDKKRHGING